MASNFLNWFRNAEYTATNETFDIGRTTLQSLAKFELKVCDASSCGESDEYSNGNGSLMRILPVAYYIYYRDITDNQEIYNIVKRVSSITHAHEVSILGCYIYVKFVLELLDGKDKIEAYENTVAACTGGLLGLYYGIGNIKDKWKQELKKYDYIIELCDKFDKM